MFRELKYIQSAWRSALGSRAFRNQFVLTIFAVVVIYLHNLHCLNVWQSRRGTEINDIILNHLRPIDFSIPIFALEYLTLLLVFIFTLPYPDRLVKGMQMFTLAVFARTVSIYFFALEPPKDMIVLYDPVANLFLDNKGTIVTKDLFFSGHISVLTLMTLIAVNKYVKRWALIATIAVGIMIMWQHVHYSIDVIFAPVVAFVSYKIVIYAHRESRYGLELNEPVTAEN